MLVLTRPLYSWISIDGGRIKVCVTQIKGKQVRLGIECDKSIKIDRLDKDQILEEIKPKAQHVNATIEDLDTLLEGEPMTDGGMG